MCERAEIAQAKQELEDSIEYPLLVQSGEKRAPATIAAEIEDSFSASRNTYYAVWFGLSAILGLLLALIRRKKKGA